MEELILGKEQHRMEKQKTKLGARVLSTEELNAILPNAESVDKQIRVFRDSIPDEAGAQKDGQYEIEQKTNNIGIMGCRGAGKTSILKTFYHKLKTENGNGKEGERNKNAGKDKGNGDVILPIIIPENMSDGTTLMDAVLGRMKSVVEEREREAEKSQYKGDCIYSRRTSLEKQYNELVKQYCYIKKDYRDILIQEFTTEQNYVEKTKKVFGSDSEFIRLFYQFVDSLLQEGKGTEGDNTEEKPLLFLFVDDVDLSVNRCMDIVRTLLVYLSHPRIVTFISGDMDTFEEALTLEFLRQEGALREDVFHETYYVSDGSLEKSSLLQRKQTLAYEYLKKIIPPAYRKMIRHWALEERGNYRIVGDKGDGSLSLVELLTEVTKEKCGDLYFAYNEDGERKCMRLAFHMFDDTARGLNNVYNVLQEIYEIQTKETDITPEQKTLLLWRLIETMVNSKPLYAGYKKELLEQIIVLGQNGVKVDFANAFQLLYGESGVQEEAGKVSLERFSAKERFAIFYLVDFAANLFRQESYGATYDEKELEQYRKLEVSIIQEYLSDETIEDNIREKRGLLACLVDGNVRRTLRTGSVQNILTDFICAPDFVFGLHLIRCLGREAVYAILGSDVHHGASVYDDKADAYKIAYAFLQATQAMSRTEKDLQNFFADFYRYMKGTMLRLLDKLSLNPWVIYGISLVHDRNIVVGDMLFIDITGNESDLTEVGFWNIENCILDNIVYLGLLHYILWVEYESRNAVYWIYYENCLREKQEKRKLFNIKEFAEEMIMAGLTQTIMNLLRERDVMNQFEVRALGDINYNGLLEGKGGKERRDFEVIFQIDKQKLWDNTYVKSTVGQYLETRKRDAVRAMSRGRVLFDATLFVTESYAALADCYKGSSGKAVIYDLESKIRKVLFLSVCESRQEERRFSDGKYYLRLEQALVIRCLLEEFLEIHWRAYYGKKEARKLLMEVQELPLLPHSEKWDGIDEELRKREDAFFAENPNLLRSRAAMEIENSDKGKSAIKNICDIWYDDPNAKSKSMETLIKEYLNVIEDKDYRYFRYLVQKRHIERRKEMLSDRKVPDWSEIEPFIPEKEYQFLFHSYLRYLQVNDNEAKNAGVRAEEIARLAAYMLDSEIQADKAVQNEFYQLISEELALTEEEFENLF